VGAALRFGLLPERGVCGERPGVLVLEGRLRAGDEVTEAEEGRGREVEVGRLEEDEVDGVVGREESLTGCISDEGAGRTGAGDAPPRGVEGPGADDRSNAERDEEAEIGTCEVGIETGRTDAAGAGAGAGAAARSASASRSEMSDCKERSEAEDASAGCC
jgi:hypothetical protein